MDALDRNAIHLILFLLGLVLLLGGIASGTPGAMIIGLIVAAVNYPFRSANYQSNR